MSELEQDDKTKNDASPAGATERARALGGQSLLALIAIIILVVAGSGLLAYSLAGGSNHPLYPALPTFTPPGTTDFQVRVISFTELNNDPASFRNQRLQVSGIYTPMSALKCLDHTGPIIRWGLVAEGLQLNAAGFEDLLRLVDEGIEMTVIGTWRLYRGPLGCGKEPADKAIWYLEVDRILEPNPLQVKIDPALTVVVGSPEFPALSTSVPEFTESEPGLDAEIEADSTPDNTNIFTPTVTIDIGQPSPLTPTPTNTLPVTPLIPIGTPVGPGTPNPTATPTATIAGATGTPGAGATNPPTIPTSTPSGTGYPPASPTSTGYP